MSTQNEEGIDKEGEQRGGSGIVSTEIIRKILREKASGDGSLLRYSRIPHYDEMPSPISVEDAIEQEAKKIANEGRRQDINLKRKTLWILFGFLAFETLLIFILAFMQGFVFFGFHLEEWSFKLVVAATISQITIMLLVAVKHLFPSH
ncbi:MAG: hypothetical protein PHU63_04555 [Candidatus ainarchaeum sp.]|nr:hypothetical protein [Candidatus ainarchaeum sp.]